MEFFRRRDIFIVLGTVVILAAGVFFILQYQNIFIKQPAQVIVSTNSSEALIIATDAQIPLPSPPPQKLSNPPEIIKAIYVTGSSAGSAKYLNYLSGLFENTEINAVVIDIKDYSGLVSYNSDAPEVKKYNLYNNAVQDIDALVMFLHSQNIYVMGRIVVFEDPAYSKARPELAIYEKESADGSPQSDNPEGVHFGSRRILWQDNNGLSWLDPASKEVWDYNISLAKDIFSHGFDEVNFDYIRFPSDGNMENIGFPVWDEKIQMSEIIKEFFIYIRQQLAGEKISADLFGQTTTSTDDMGIGQVIENAFENFDYISPMVYPSHYANGFLGFDNPADHPYEIIKYSMDTALSRKKSFLNKLISTPGVDGDLTPGVNTTINLAKFRPWLQDFNMGAYYTADKVKAEIKATQDALGSDYNGFMLWNPSNIYTQGAILKPN